MKKVFLLTVAAASLILGTGCSANFEAPVKEELDANIIVQLKGGVEGKSEESVIRLQNNLLSEIRSYVTTDFEVGDRFTTLVNAFSLKINSSHVDEIENLANVKRVNYNTAHGVTSVEDGLVNPRKALNVKEVMENYSATTMNIPSDTKEGEGVLIAILDTGYLLNGQTFDDEGKVTAENVTHRAFRKLADDVELHDNYESINAKITASTGFHGRPDANHPVYWNSKVPFYYDYGGLTHERGEVGDEDHDVFSSLSDHGTHVASTAAGNDPLYKGIAPKAQLALMKVFTDYVPSTKDAEAGYTASTGAYDTSILKALEDCAVLGADIISMSLGSALNDFDKDSIVTQAFKILEKRNVFINVAAGNEGKETFERSAYEYWSTDMIETGILSTYSSSDSAMVIAASQADKEYYSTALVISGKVVQFRDQVENYNSSDGEVVYNPERHIADLIKDHPDGKFEWVKIGGWGESSDYENVDVAGKIAIVDRGETTFANKISCAQNAGAIAIGVIDNDPTNTDFSFRMDLSGWTPDIPVISLLFKDKDFIDSATDHTAQLLVDTIADNPTKGLMTSFSSDGPTYDLRIKPDIATPGQSIMGGVNEAADAYDFYQGTSMATPNYSGAVAVMLSENNNASYRSSINDRLMSTANIMKDKFGTNFESVRRQGAGMADVGGALASKVYLDGSTTENLKGRAKIELGNNAEIKVGNVNLAFTAVNEGSESVTYKATTYIYRPELVELDEEQFPDFVGKKLQATYNHLIAKVEQNVTLAPGANLIDLEDYQISAADLAEIDSNFENGCYIEGYVVLTADNQETLNIPFLGFYGDLDSAMPVEPFTFERDSSKVYASDVLNSVIHKWKGLEEADYASSWYAGYYKSMSDISMEKVILNESNVGKMVDANGKTLLPVGVNPFTGESTGSDIYVGNNGYTNTMIISQYVLRSVATNTITITNKATGKVVLNDHMFDSLYGATEDENENDIAWPLFKSHVNVDYWSAGYISHRAYTIIPLYSMSSSGSNLGNFPDGQYDMTFRYVLPNGSVFTKQYTLHIDSDAPIVKSVEQYEENGETYTRVRYNENTMAYYVVGGTKINFSQDSQGYYYDFKESDFTNGCGFVQATDLANAYTRSLVKFGDSLEMVVSNPNFNMQHAFSYTMSDDANNDKIKNFELSFTSNGKSTSVNGNFDITMKLPSGLDFEHLIVYTIRGSKATRARVQQDGDLIRFTVSNKTFRLDSTATNDTSYSLNKITAYSCTSKLFVGDTFSTDSITVMGTYETGYVQEITEGITYDTSALNTNKAGDYTIKVSVGNLSYSIQITVMPAYEGKPVVALEEMPNVTVDPNGTRNPYDHASDHDPEPEVEPTPEPQPEPQPSKKKGCGGSIIASSAILSITAALGASLLFLKKRKEK